MTEQKTPGGEQSPSGNSVIFPVTDKAIEIMSKSYEAEVEPDLDDEGEPLVYKITQR